MEHTYMTLDFTYTRAEYEAFATFYNSVSRAVKAERNRRWFLSFAVALALDCMLMLPAMVYLMAKIPGSSFGLLLIGFAFAGVILWGLAALFLVARYNRSLAGAVVNAVPGGRAGDWFCPRRQSYGEKELWVEVYGGGFSGCKRISYGSIREVRRENNYFVLLLLADGSWLAIPRRALGGPAREAWLVDFLKFKMAQAGLDVPNTPPPPEGKPRMTLEFSRTKEDYAAYSRHEAGRHGVDRRGIWRRRAGLSLLVFLWMLFVYLTWYTRLNGFERIGVLLLCVGLWAGLSVLLCWVREKWRRASFRRAASDSWHGGQLGYWTAPRRCLAYGDRLLVESFGPGIRGRWEVAYPDITAVEEEDGALYLYCAESQALYIPLSAFEPGEWAQFLDLLAGGRARKAPGEGGGADLQMASPPSRAQDGGGEGGAVHLPMTLEYIPTGEEYVVHSAFLEVNPRRKNVWQWVRLCIVAVYSFFFTLPISLFGGVSLRSGYPVALVALLFCVFWLVFTLIFYFSFRTLVDSPRQSAAKEYDKSAWKRWSVPHRCTLLEDELVLETFFPGDYTRRRVAYASLEEVRREGGGFHIYAPDETEMFLPERAFVFPGRADWFAGFLEEKRRAVGPAPALAAHVAQPACAPLMRFSIARTKREYTDWLIYYRYLQMPVVKWYILFVSVLISLLPIFFVWLVYAWTPLSSPRFLPEAIAAVWAAVSALLAWVVYRWGYRCRRASKSLRKRVDRLEQEGGLRNWSAPRTHALYSDALVVGCGCPGVYSHRHIALSAINGMVESGENLVLHIVNDTYVVIPLRAFATPADKARFTGQVAARMAPPGWSPWPEKKP